MGEYTIKMLATLTILSTLVYVGSAGLPGLNLKGVRQQCPPKPPTIPTLELERYLGKWYEQKRIPASFQLNTRCVRAEYGINDDNEVTVHNTATKENGDFDEIRGTAYVPDPEHPGELLVHSCVDYLLGLIHFEFAWILTRENVGDPEIIQKGVDLLASYDIDVSLLEDTVQNDDCYYGEDLL